MEFYHDPLPAIFRPVMADIINTLSRTFPVPVQFALTYHPTILMVYKFDPQTQFRLILESPLPPEYPWEGVFDLLVSRMPLGVFLDRKLAAIIVTLGDSYVAQIRQEKDGR